MPGGIDRGWRHGRTDKGGRGDGQRFAQEISAGDEKDAFIYTDIKYDNIYPNPKCQVNLAAAPGSARHQVQSP